MKSLFGVVVLGDSNVGKTHICRGITNAVTQNAALRWPFSDHCESTRGFDFNSFSVDDNSVVGVLDTTSEDRFATIKKSYVKGSHIQILVFDLTNAETFTNLEKYLGIIDKSGTTRNIILIANKSDLYDKRQVSEFEIQAFMQKNAINLIFEVSCKEQMHAGLSEIVKLIKQMLGIYTPIISVGENSTNTNRSRSSLNKENYYYLLALSGLKLILNALLTIISLILVVMTFPLMLACPSLNPFVNNKQHRGSYFKFWGETKSKESLAEASTELSCI